MNLTKSDFKVIEKALQILSGDMFNNLSEENKQLVLEADVVMVNLLRKQLKDNDRTAKAIAEKRKLDKGYARSSEEKKKYRNT